MLLHSSPRLLCQCQDPPLSPALPANYSPPPNYKTTVQTGDPSPFLLHCQNLTDSTLTSAAPLFYCEFKMYKNATVVQLASSLLLPSGRPFYTVMRRHIQAMFLMLRFRGLLQKEKLSFPCSSVWPTSNIASFLGLQTIKLISAWSERAGNSDTSRPVCWCFPPEAQQKKKTNKKKKNKPV